MTHLDILLDKRKEARTEVKRVEQSIAVEACPHKLGQLVTYTHKGGKVQAIITQISFRVTPPYYYISLSVINEDHTLKKPRRVYRESSLTILDLKDGKNDALLKKRVKELSEKGFIL
jgi:hypothetical protein